MQRENVRRGFSVTHQKVVLDIDLAGYVRGFTEITITPTSRDLQTIHLHSRQCVIHGVSVSGRPADFVFHDPVQNIAISKPDDIHTFPEIKRKLYAALAEADEGELSIAIPEELVPKRTGPVATAPGAPASSSRGTPDPSITGGSGSDFAPMIVTIEYSLRHPRDGLQFVLPTETYPYRVPHMYTTPSSPDAARCWVPCVDSLWERCTWDFELIVPKSLGGSSEDDLDGDEGHNDDEIPVLVICSGELVERVAHPHDSKKTIFVYSQSSPTTVQHVAFAVGPFHVHEIALDSTIVTQTGTDDAPVAPPSQIPMHVFCLPGLETSLETTTSFYRSAMNFFTAEYGSYPFGSHKLVFVDELHTVRFDAATLSLCSNDLLHGSGAIDQVYTTRHSLSHALACQWIGINIIPKAWADIWLVNGLGLYITGLFIRRLFGNNEYRFRLRKDMDRVYAADMGAMPPICRPTLLEPPDPSVLPFVNLKSPIVLYILDRRLGKSGTALGLSRVLPKIFLSAISGELTNNVISTHSFLRTCRKVSAVDVRSFADQWIYGSGCPGFTFQATFNRKKMAVELLMTQESPAYLAHQDNPVQNALLRPVQTFEGQMSVRIHEADGTPYEHVLDIRSSQKKYEVPFNTKYKRVRRNTKRFQARQAAAAAAAAGDSEAAEAMEMIDSGFELKLWEDEKMRSWWMVTDWTEEDEAAMNGSSYEWIRLDADFEWITSIRFDQPDFMWVSQLQRDRDVVAQLEAIHALAAQPTLIVSSTLTKTVLVTNYFFRIRAEAARMLVTCAKPALKDIGLLHLFKLFSRYCYQPQTLTDPLRAKFVPKANDFSDFAEYFVRKSLIAAISDYRDAEGKSGHTVRRFLVDQLRYNDNSKNPYTDALYIGTIIASLGRSLLPYGPPEYSELSHTVWAPELDEEDKEVRELALTEIERYREMDRLNPSPHNVISIAILEWYIMMQLGAMLPMDHTIFIAYSREGNYTAVRTAAFECLLLNPWFQKKGLSRYLFAVAAHDPSRTVRRFVARALIDSLGILYTVGDVSYVPKDGDKSVLIEDDGSNSQKAKQLKKTQVELALKAIRKSAGKFGTVREVLMPTLLAPDVDYEVRWSMLKLAELLFRPTEEVPPKVSFKLAAINRAPVVDDSLITPSETPADIAPVRTPIPPPEPILPVKLKRPSKQNYIVFPKDTTPAPVPTPRPVREPIVREPVPAPMPEPAYVPVPVPVSMPMPVSVSAPPPQPSYTPSFVEVVPQEAPPVPIQPPPRPSVTVPPPLAKNVTFNVQAPVHHKKKKEKAVPKAQSAGMQAKDVQACRNVLKKLVTHPASLVFRQPVDPVRDKAPGYFDLIKRPMDLSTMSAKLDAGHYKDLKAFRDDFDLMVNNARIYNTPQSYVCGEALKLESFFNKSWQKIKTTLEAMDKSKSAHATAAAPPPAPLPEPVPPPPVIPQSPAPMVKAEKPDPFKPATKNAITPSGNYPTVKIKITTKERPRNPTPKVDPVHSKSASPAPAPSVPRPNGIIVNAKSRRPRVDFTPSPAASPAPTPRATPAPSVPKSTPTPAPPPKAAPPTPTPPIAPTIKPEPERAPSIDEAALLIEEELGGFGPIEASPVPVKPTVKLKRPKPISPPKKLVEDKKVARSATPRVDSVPVTPAKASGSHTTPSVARSTASSSSRKPISATPSASASSKAKGKQKEVPASKAGAVAASAPIDTGKCRSILKSLNSLPESWLFLKPVDAILSGCPTYYDEIKHPMDFETIGKKLSRGEYSTMDQFADDVDLVFRNCRQFNPPGTDPVIMCDKVSQHFYQEWNKVVQKRISPADKRAILGTLNKLKANPNYIWFKDPVNTKIFPEYHDVIPKKDARDLTLLTSKLNEDKYDSLEALEADMAQLVKNARTFNGEAAEVTQLAGAMARELSAAISAFRKKRGRDDKGNVGGSVKKMKMG